MLGAIAHSDKAKFLDMAIIEPRVIDVRSGSATIRATDSTDAGATVALRLAMAQETEFLAEEPREVRTDVEEEASFLTGKLNSPVDLYILAEVQGRVVGIVRISLEVVETNLGAIRLYESLGFEHEGPPPLPNEARRHLLRQ